MSQSALEIEQNGLNVIPESERHDQFWPWAASNISVWGISFAGFILGFGLSFTQALLASIVGIAFSFGLVGIIALAGKRGSAPTLVLSRAAFGVRGNALPTFVSYLLLVGWETVLVAVGVLATGTITEKLGWSLGENNIGWKAIAFVFIVGVVVFSGVYGFKFIMKIQKWITLAGIVLTGLFILLTASSIDFNAVGAASAGDFTAVIAGMIMAMTGFGLGWVNGGADYSRYLPRNSRSRSIFGWTTFGASIAPIVLISYGLLLALSVPDIGKNIGSDPIGSLIAALPTSAQWFVLPYLIVVLLGLIGGAILDIYSSGLNLLTLGLKLKRYQAASIDGVLMALGTAYVVFVSDSFFWPFQAGLYLLGVPMAAWAGIFIADLLQRKKNYDDASLYKSSGRYGSVNLVSVGVMVVAVVVGFGFIASPDASLTWTTWEGYLYAALGITGDNSAWYWSNIGVLLALIIGFVGKLALDGANVRKQEA